MRSCNRHKQSVGKKQERILEPQPLPMDLDSIAQTKLNQKRGIIEKSTTKGVIDDCLGGKRSSDEDASSSSIPNNHKRHTSQDHDSRHWLDIAPSTRPLSDPAEAVVLAARLHLMRAREAVSDLDVGRT
jgi:hypothetical protein